MKSLLLKGCWNIAWGKVKQALGRWSDDSIEFQQGKQEELLGRIQKRKAEGESNIPPAIT